MAGSQVPCDFHPATLGRFVWVARAIWVPYDLHTKLSGFPKYLKPEDVCHLLQARQAGKALHGMERPHGKHGGGWRPGLPPIHQVWERRHGPAPLRNLAYVTGLHARRTLSAFRFTCVACVRGTEQASHRCEIGMVHVS